MKLSTTFVRPKHAYTRERVPWQLDDADEVMITSETGKRFGWNLFRYLSGGGMAELGRTSRQELMIRRQRRFLYVAAGIVAAWIVFMFI